MPVGILLANFLRRCRLPTVKYVRGKLHSRGQAKRADYILYYKPNIPVAIVEEEANKIEKLMFGT